MNIAIKNKFLDMLPGILVWSTLLGAILFSFIKPIWAIYFIIAFDIYWMLKILYLLFYMVSSWKKYKRDSSIHWMDKLISEKMTDIIILYFYRPIKNRLK